MSGIIASLLHHCLHMMT